MKKLFAILLSLAMLVCFMPTMAFAGGVTSTTTGTIYVDNVKGVDSNDGTTADVAVKTMDKAIELGDVIKVIGTYNDAVDVTGIAKGVTIENGGDAVFTKPLKLTSASSNITVKGLKFEGVKVAGGSENAAAIDINATGQVDVIGNTISGVTSTMAGDSTGMGIRIRNAANVDVSSNTISNVTHNGINIYGGALTSIKVINNTITNWGQNQSENIQGRAIRVAAATGTNNQIEISSNIMSNTIKPDNQKLKDKDFYLKLTELSTTEICNVNLSKNYWGSATPNWMSKDLAEATSIVTATSDGGNTAIAGIKDNLFPYLKYEKDSSYLITDANGTTVYNLTGERTINVDGTKGDNATADGSLEAPFKTIGAAIEATKTVDNQEASDVIKVAAGTYGDAVDVVDIARPLTVEGVGNVVLNAPIKLESTNGSAITVQNLQIRDLTNSNMGTLEVALEINTAGKIVIKNNTINNVNFENINGSNGRSVGMGIRAGGSNNITVQNNTISNTQHNGINLGGAADTSTMLIDGNTITNWSKNNIEGRAMRIGFYPTTPQAHKVTITNNVMSNTDANLKATTDDGFYLKLTDVTASATVDLSHNYWGAKAPDFIGTGAIFSKDDKITSVIATSNRAATTAIADIKDKLFPFYQDASKYYLQKADGSVEYKGPSTPTPPTPEKPKEEVVTQPDGSTITTTTETDKTTGAETKSEVVKDKDGQITAKTEATAPVKSEVTGTTATATVGKDVADKLLEQTKAAEKKAAASGATKSESTITLDVKTAGTVAKAEVSLPADTLGKIANETSASVKVETSVGSIEFDQKALQEITKGQTTGNVKLVAEIINTNTMPQEVQEQLGENAMVVDLSVQTDAGKTTDFNGGSATVSIAIPAGVDPTKLGAVYIRTDGKLERVEGKVVMVNGKPVFQFLTGHFSKYAILDQATIDKTIAAQNAKLVKGVKATKLTAIKAVAKKSNVTVTWKKSKGYKVDGYQIWKSSKKTTGYKMMTTRTGQKYKNTYGLKAGKTYYYKVRGFREIDGQNVYTKWAKVKVVAK